MLILKDNQIFNLDNIISINLLHSDDPNFKSTISLTKVNGEDSLLIFDTNEQAEKAFHYIFECHHEGYKSCGLDHFLTTLESD